MTRRLLDVLTGATIGVTLCAAALCWAAENADSAGLCVLLAGVVAFCWMTGGGR